jgi:murein DD-endopeptidase MepM/ murein hydrolase activator NlpD
VLAGVFGLVATLGTPALAQTPPTTDPSSTTTTVPPDTSTTLPPEDTTTTLPGDTTTTTGPEEDPAQGADGGNEPVAVVDDPVPSRGLYANQESFQVAMAVRGSLKVAKATSLQTKAEHEAAVAHVAVLEAALMTLRSSLANLQADQRAALADLTAAREQLQERAADAYVRGSFDTATTALSSGNANDYFSKVALLDSVLETDKQVIDRYVAAKARVGEDLQKTAVQLLQTQTDLDLARLHEAETAKEAESAAFDLAVFSKGGKISIRGFVFPVADPHQFIDSFGFPRMVGTPDQHWHEGTDIMAPAGTELYATERGILTQVGTNSLGGITLWLKGESGTYYYYAHLSRYAEGVHKGLVVEAGQLVGYVGTTGNAAGGPAHVHFEVHPDGGKAVDPYPLLEVVDEMRKAQAKT